MNRRTAGAQSRTLQPGQSLAFTLPFVPRTKKNSRRHIKRRAQSGKQITVPLPSEAYASLEAQIVRLVRASGLDWNLSQPVNCAAILYRDANRGDAVGYYQALGDALEAAGVVSNDKWIVQWDGSRLRKDADKPRIDVVLTPVAGEEK